MNIVLHKMNRPAVLCALFNAVKPTSDADPHRLGGERAMANVGTAKGVLLWLSDSFKQQNAGAWYLRRIDLTTGAQSAVAVSGLSLSSYGGIGGLEWIDWRGYYLAYIGNNWVKLVPNADHTAVTANAYTPAGTLSSDVNLRRAIYKDTRLQIVLVNYGHNLQMRFFKPS